MEEKLYKSYEIARDDLRVQALETAKSDDVTVVEAYRLLPTDITNRTVNYLNASVDLTLRELPEGAGITYPLRETLTRSGKQISQVTISDRTFLHATEMIRAAITGADKVNNIAAVELAKIFKEKLYRTAGFHSLGEYANLILGISQPVASRWVSCARFLNPDGTVKPEYPDFNMTQLSEFLPLFKIKKGASPEEVEEKEVKALSDMQDIIGMFNITELTTAKQIRDAVKTYITTGGNIPTIEVEAVDVTEQSTENPVESTEPPVESEEVEQSKETTSTPEASVSEPENAVESNKSDEEVKKVARRAKVALNQYLNKRDEAYLQVVKEALEAIITLS